MLGFVILSSAFSLILGFKSGGFLITILEIRVDVLGDAVNLVFDLRQTLNPILQCFLLESVLNIIMMPNDYNITIVIKIL